MKRSQKNVFLFQFHDTQTNRKKKDIGYVNFLAVDTIRLIANECKGKLCIYIVDINCYCYVSQKLNHGELTGRLQIQNIIGV